MKYFTEQQAKALAGLDKQYRARQQSIGATTKTWIVWDDASDHHVEFDRTTVINIARD